MLDDANLEALLQRIEAGDPQALNELLAHCRGPLRSFVERHLGLHLHARFDPSDVVQEAQLEVARRLTDYLSRRPMPFHLWLRKTAYENLVRLWRHAEAGRRDRAREVSLSDHTSLLLAQKLMRQQESPSN